MVTPSDRKEALARYVDGWSAQAIAEALGAPLEAVEAILPGGAKAPAPKVPAPVAAKSAASAPTAPEPALAVAPDGVRAYGDDTIAVRLPHVRVGL